MRLIRSQSLLPGWSIPIVFVVGAISQYVGAAIGVFLFETTEPATVAWLRAAAAAVALVAWRRPWRRRWTRRQAGVALMFGLVTIAMNIAIYEAISRIPLGTAVAIEFLGPTAVAALGSRRRRDFAAVGLACGGVLLLAGVEFDANLTGVLFALVSAAMWAGYILLGKRVADTGDGLDSLAVGMSLAAVVLAPAILIPQAASTLKCSPTRARGCSVSASVCCPPRSPTRWINSSSSRSAARSSRFCWHFCR